MICFESVWQLAVLHKPGYKMFKSLNNYMYAAQQVNTLIGEES